jgi:hypothetical protein
LSELERRVLGEHYAALGRMEHASVAAFARFALELLSLGAPASLLSETSAALADEVRHAEQCFGLASAYGGASLGPGPLELAGVMDGASSLELAERAFLEGCVGETSAALEAAHAARVSTDPVVREVLTRIAEDELRHSELAFRFVAYCAANAGSQRSMLTARLRAALANATPRAAAPAAADPPNSARLSAHGWLPPSARHAVAEAAFREVVAPCVEALLAACAVEGTAAAAATS